MLHCMFFYIFTTVTRGTLQKQKEQSDSEPQFVDYAECCPMSHLEYEPATLNAVENCVVIAFKSLRHSSSQYKLYYFVDCSVLLTNYQSLN